MENPEIQINSTTLGNPNENSAITAGKEIFTGIESYTNTVVTNAEELKSHTEKELPEAKFGVSVLASSINPEQMGNLITSIDYPYYTRILNKEFLREKVEKVKSEGEKGFGLGVGLVSELAYAQLQSHTPEHQMNSTMNAALFVKSDPIRIRTCVETVSLEEELKKIKEVNDKLKDKGKRVTWVVEPNKKIGNGNLSSFLNILENIKRDNQDLNWGIDLDLGGLPKEDRSLLNILDILDKNQLFPLLVSLSGKEFTSSGIVSHLPLGDDIEYNQRIGEWFKMRLYRGQEIPGIVIETSPAQKPLTDYRNFLKAFKSGFLS
jgi:hypothetical protein